MEPIEESITATLVVPAGWIVNTPSAVGSPIMLVGSPITLPHLRSPIVEVSPGKREDSRIVPTLRRLRSPTIVAMRPQLDRLKSGRTRWNVGRARKLLAGNGSLRRQMR
jgi:hypothetical protein